MHQLDVESGEVLAAKLADVKKTEGKQYTDYRMALMARAKALATCWAKRSLNRLGLDGGRQPPKVAADLQRSGR